MRIRVSRWLLFCLWCSWYGYAAAVQVVPAPPEVAAKAYILVDHDSARVMVEHNADERLEPASLTKMMTAYVVFSELAEAKIKLTDQVRISEKAWRMPGSRSFIEVNSQVPVEILLKGVIVQSGNDASVALAEHIAGDEATFARLMNQYAQRLGMTGTNFVNASGLPDPDHFTTARDMATLSSALIRDFPELYRWHAIKQFLYNDIVQRNRNKLLWRDESVDGLKTGYTKSAGYCLVVSARREEMRLISVVMGSKSVKSRTRESQAMLNFGFRFYETHRVYGANQPVTKIRVWQGDTEMLPIGLDSDLFVTVPRGQYKQIDASMELEAQVIAPVQQGDVQGRMKLRLGETQIAERSLVALSNVGAGNLWRQVSDYVRLLFE